jgi:hypothetical protein
MEGERIKGENEGWGMMRLQSAKTNPPPPSKKSLQEERNGERKSQKMNKKQ